MRNRSDPPSLTQASTAWHSAAVNAGFAARAASRRARRVGDDEDFVGPQTSLVNGFLLDYPVTVVGDEVGERLVEAAGGVEVVVGFVEQHGGMLRRVGGAAIVVS